MKKTICIFLACLGITFSAYSSASGLELRAIAPDGVGLTLQKSPVLYYFISEPTTLPIVLTLSDPRSARRFVEVALPSPNRPGFWPIKLKDYEIILDAAVEYRWFVSVIQVQEDVVILDEDIVVGGSIECCPDDLFFIWDGRRCDTDTVHAYAKAGIWYDAFACLGELIDSEPNNQKLLHLRERLGSDGGLKLTHLQ